MDYIIYTAEGYTQTPNGNETNNCQILDFVYNTNLMKTEVVELFLNNFPVKETELSKKEIKVINRIDEATKEAMYEIVKYLWETEERNYEESSEKDKTNHIFNYLRILAHYFGKEYESPDTFKKGFQL